MAFLTGHSQVLPDEWKIRLGVIEFGGWREVGGGVALGAIVAEGRLVAVVVAIDTAGFQPQPGSASGFQFAIVDVIRLVAGPAVGGLVGAREFVTREPVIEGFFVEARHRKIAAVVIAVAAGAFFSAYVAGSVVARF